MTNKLIEKMLQQAIKKGSWGFTDSIFRSKIAVSNATISKKLKENNIIHSMSRKGICLDHPAIKNFFSVIKPEFFYPPIVKLS